LEFLNYDTFTTAIFDQYNVAFDGASAAMLTSVLLVLCLFILGLELLLRGNAKYATNTKGSASEPEIISLGWKTPLIVMCFIILFIFCSRFPLGILRYRLFTGTSATFDWAEILLSLYSTLSFCLRGSLLAILVALPLVILAIRYKGTFSVLADRLPYFIHSLPGL